jgi:F-type H+-transporting ATPase subunit gamma
MTERLAEVRARIDGIRQLGAVVNAMRGIAAARAQQARNQLAAVDSYAQTIAQAIGRSLTLAPAPRPDGAKKTGRVGLVVFCAEQGFAGAFSEHVLDSLGPDLAGRQLFLIGTRGADIAAQRNIKIDWKSAMPSHSPGAPKLGDRIADALYRRIAAGAIDQLDAVFTLWEPGRGMRVERRRLFPLDLARFVKEKSGGGAPLANLPAEALLSDLAADYLHAQLCQAALHAFAAENQARMEAMAAAHRQVESQLTELQATERRVRQDEITAEIIELAAGESAYGINSR